MEELLAQVHIIQNIELEKSPKKCMTLVAHPAVVECMVYSSVPSE